MSWYVYIARCGDNSLYTGVTTDPKRRLKEHNKGQGSRYVRRKGTATLVYAKGCSDKSEAHRRESEIKSWHRAKKLNFVKSNGVQQTRL